MATMLEKTIKRVLIGQIDRDTWVIEMERGGITFRRKGGKKRFPTVPWAKVWLTAMHMEAARVKLEKAAKRKARKEFKSLI